MRQGDPHAARFPHPAATGRLAVPGGQEADPARCRAALMGVGQLQQADRASVGHEEDAGREVAAGQAGAAEERREHRLQPPFQRIECEHDAGPEMKKGNERNSLPLTGRLSKRRGLTAPHDSTTLRAGNEGAKTRNRQVRGHDESVHWQRLKGSLGSGPTTVYVKIAGLQWPQ